MLLPTGLDWHRCACACGCACPLQHLCLGESCPPSPHPETRQLSPSRLSLGPLELLPRHWSAEPVSPAGRKSVRGPLRRSPGTALALLSPGCHLHWFSQPGVVGTPLPGPGTLGREPDVGLDPSSSQRGPLQLTYPSPGPPRGGNRSSHAPPLCRGGFRCRSVASGFGSAGRRRSSVTGSVADLSFSCGRGRR